MMVPRTNHVPPAAIAIARPHRASVAGSEARGDGDSGSDTARRVMQWAVDSRQSTVAERVGDASAAGKRLRGRSSRASNAIAGQLDERDLLPCAETIRRTPVPGAAVHVELHRADAVEPREVRFEPAHDP